MDCAGGHDRGRPSGSFEVLVTRDVDREVFRLETHVLPTVVARRKRLPVHAGNFVYFAVLDVMNHRVDSRRFAGLPRFKDIPYIHGH